MKILIFGDIVAKPGRKAIATLLPQWRQKYQVDLVIANAENLSHGIGVTPASLEEMRSAGVDFFTSGNHIWKKPDINTVLQSANPVIIRPENYPPGLPGTGHRLLTVGVREILVINLMGRVFFKEHLDCPFRALDAILSEFHVRGKTPSTGVSRPVDGIFVDFHAEASSEKNALGRYADGRVTAFWGTHTHVPSGDSMTLKHGTVYRSDIGMTGLKDSVIGANTESIIKQFLTQLGDAKMHDVDEHGEVIINGQLLDFDGLSVNTWQALQESIII
ncbi:YmdB family metallophosphoesterase [Candidatus Uhrbacteria bacterium]|nr:YmdB family metallophosphoesterase [Candidatus Uhrbacteria bacterium]